MPQAIGLSSDTSQGTPNSWAIFVVASIIASGPQQTMRHGHGDSLTTGTDQVRHKPVMVQRAVVGAQSHLNAGLAEVVDAGQVFAAADAVAERDALGPRNLPRRVAVSVQAEMLAGQGQKRGLPNAAGDHHQVLGGGCGVKGQSHFR